MIGTQAGLRFDDYVARQHHALLRFATALTGDVHLAEEVVADVLVKAYERWDQIAAATYPHAYVRRMIVNRFVSWRRKWGRIVPTADDARPEPSLPDVSGAHAERDAVLAALTGLPRRQRAALVLRYFEDLSVDEIATTMQCTPGTVRSHISRALGALRITMTDDEAAIAVAERTDHA